MSNEAFKAVYLYRLEGDHDLTEFVTSPDASDDEPKFSFRTVDGEALLVVEQRLQPGESIVEVGCNAAPKQSTLISIERERFAKEDEE
ncbi:MAG: hypothetical protein H6918_09095 [Sphingomonadaceae bacterium]|nr:hypothetical protein [Sphingomonadaceae bacterium]